jgi:hypothetical protein
MSKQQSYDEKKCDEDESDVNESKCSDLGSTEGFEVHPHGRSPMNYSLSETPQASPKSDDNASDMLSQLAEAPDSPTGSQSSSKTVCTSTSMIRHIRQDFNSIGIRRQGLKSRTSVNHDRSRPLTESPPHRRFKSEENADVDPPSLSRSTMQDDYQFYMTPVPHRSFAIRNRERIPKNST